VLDAGACIRKLCYDMGQAVKAGLFESGEYYPGLCFRPTNLTEPLTFRRNSLIAAIDPDGSRFPAKVLSLKLSIPRPFLHLGRAAYKEVLQDALNDYESSVASPSASTPNGMVACRSARLGRQFKKVRQRWEKHGDIHYTPEENNPRAYSSDPALTAAFEQEKREFNRQHQTSFELLREGHGAVRFPAGSYRWRKLLKLPSLAAPRPCYADVELWFPD
jgi:hypothetical protein